MSRRPLLMAASLSLLLAACSDRPTSVDAPAAVPADFLQPALSVLDGTQEGGNPHFFWLKPLGEKSKKGGDFPGVADPDQLPAVEICLRDDDAVDGCAAGEPLVARFTRTDGRKSERIKVDGKGAYSVHRRMDDKSSKSTRKSLRSAKDDGAQYRIRVVIQDTELGHADVIVLRNKSIKAYDGRVMVTGGVSQVSGTSIASTEIYNPMTGTFSPGPPMVQHRLDHGATLLLDGRILVMGGVALGGGGILSSAELYFP